MNYEYRKRKTAGWAGRATTEGRRVGWSEWGNLSFFTATEMRVLWDRTERISIRNTQKNGSFEKSVADCKK